MTVYHDIPFRSARDHLISLLFQNSDPPSKSEEGAFEPVQRIIPDPLKDLPIFYNSTVTKNKPADFYILGAQKDTDYILCDKEDVPLKVDGQEITGNLLPLENNWEDLIHTLRSCRTVSTETSTEIIIPEPEDAGGINDFAQTWRRVAQITSPVIIDDETFRILARKKNVTGSDAQLEEYLLSAVSVRVGIDTSLTVQFIARLDTDVLNEKGDRIVINFDQPKAANLPLKVKIPQPQEGINYQLLEIIDGKRTKRSEAVLGGTRTTEGDMSIELLTTGTFAEDTELIVRAFRDNKESTNTLLAGDLDQKLTVAVRPNKELKPSFTADKIPYNDSTSINLDKTQKSVSYQLFARPVELSEYSSDGALEIEDVESIDKDSLVSIGKAKSGKEGETISFETGRQQEDSVFIIEATKANGEKLRIKKGLVLLVQPNPAPSVTAKSSTLSTGDEGLVILKKTQKGVKYQLAAGNKTIGEYGYHFSDRAIGVIDRRREFGMRIETDFKIGTDEDTADTLFSDGTLRLPAGPVKKTTTFKVIAKKSYTGLEAELSGVVEITVETPS